jgi:hypothetical protein
MADAQLRRLTGESDETPPREVTVQSQPSGPGADIGAFTWLSCQGAAWEAGGLLPHCALQLFRYPVVLLIL